MSARRLASTLLLLVALVGCGGGSKTAAKPSPTPTVDPQVAITQTWEAFFSPAGSVASHVALLEDGASFTSELTTASTSQQAKALSAKVVKVLVTGTSAIVTYNLLSKGAPLLTGATGTAVNVNGTWKVSKLTFCQLTRLQDPTGKHPACG